MQRCKDCYLYKWCKEVLLGYEIASSNMDYYPIIKKLNEREKSKFNNYRCFRKRKE